MEVIITLIVLVALFWFFISVTMYPNCANCGKYHGRYEWKSEKNPHLIFLSKECSKEYWVNHFQCDQCDEIKSIRNVIMDQDNNIVEEHIESEDDGFMRFDSNDLSKYTIEGPNFISHKYRKDYYSFCHNDCMELYRKKKPTIFYEGDKRHSISSELRQRIFNRDNGQCCKCGSKHNLEIDHIIPVSKGGATSLKNLELLCLKCNRSKGAKIE